MSIQNVCYGLWHFLSIIYFAYIHLFPDLRAFCFLEKNALRVSGTVIMFQLTRNSPTSAYISLNPRKWKFALVETALCGD